MAEDSLEELLKVFEGVKFTFSKDCRSGIVGKENCQCWRCKKERGEPADEPAGRREP